MTTCKKCESRKPPGEFYKYSKPEYLMHGVCKSCISELYWEAKERVVVLLRDAPATPATCTVCQTVKTISEFPPSSAANTLVGFPAACRTCNAARVRERYWKLKNARKAFEKSSEELT